MVAEEHVERGSFGWELLITLQKIGLPPVKFMHFFAKKHIYEDYGSQDYLREKSQLDVASIILAMKDL